MRLAVQEKEDEDWHQHARRDPGERPEDAADRD